MASTSLSSEDENYVRMSLLLTGISPRAVRKLFDREFAPSCLDASIKKEYNALNDLKLNHRINQSQWNLLFPRHPDVPNSKSFDIILMITLLRNLTAMEPPQFGYEKLPTSIEITPAADLCRIKYYRNYFAHLDQGNIDTAFFQISWTDMTGAINRLGGEQMKLECDQLKTKPLDQTNQEIMMDVKRSSNEIRELRGSLENLKLSCIEMKKCNAILNENHEEVKKSFELLNEKVTTLYHDTVPWNIRAQIDKTLGKWKDRDSMFVETRAAQHVLNSLTENNCVTITACSGVGKTATLRHVALLMAKDGYDVLPIIDPYDIIKFYNPTKKTLFVIDDLCGNFSLNQIDIKTWKPIMKPTKEILENKDTKLIVACRLQVYQDDKFHALSIFKSCVCNLLSNKMCLLEDEKKAIAELYLNTEAPRITDYYSLYDCFPLLCKLYHGNPSFDITEFFQHPFLVYDEEIDKLQKNGYFSKYCALALCVMFNNKVMENMFTEEINGETRSIIENTCEVCKLETGTSRLILKDELDSLTHTFVKKDHELYVTQENYSIILKVRHFYTAKHDKLFDLVAHFFGQKIIASLIKNAHSRLIRERFLLERKDDMSQFIIVVPPIYHQMYIQRMIEDWSKGKLQDVFNNINMNIQQFRQILLSYLKTCDTSYQKQLVHTRNVNVDDGTGLGILYVFRNLVYDTVILQCCFIGDIEMIKWCLKYRVDVNHCASDDPSPLMVACRHGHSQVVRLLLDKKVDYNKYNRYRESPFSIAINHDHTEIAIMLLDKITIQDKSLYCAMALCLMFDNKVRLEIMTADIDKETRTIIENTCVACNLSRETPILTLKEALDSLSHTIVWVEHINDQMIQNGKIILIDNGFYMISSKRLFGFLAHYCGQKIINCLIENADSHFISQMFLLEKKDDMDEFTTIVPTDYHHMYLQRIIKDWSKGKLKDVFNNINMKIFQFRQRFMSYLNTLDSFFQQQLANTYEVIEDNFLWLQFNYHWDVVCDTTMLQCCALGDISLIQWCSNRGVDINECGLLEQSPLMVACRYNHTELVGMLLDKEADIDKCDLMNLSPIIISCEHGHTEIVRILLDKGVTFDEFDMKRRTPIMLACDQGYTEIVRMLLDIGADYNVCDYRSNSPAMVACRHGYVEIMRMLLEKDVDYELYDNEGRTLLMIACECGHTEIARILLDKGADYTECNYFGRLPEHYASVMGHNDIVTMITEQYEKNKDTMQNV